MIVEAFSMEHYKALFGNENPNCGIVNLTTGPAFALIDRGAVLAIGGVRVTGIGQAWAYLSEEAKQKRNVKSVLRTAKAVIHESITAEKLYRIYAEATVDKPAWFKHLGFEPMNNVFVR